jgi:hypothetical protein
MMAPPKTAIKTQRTHSDVRVPSPELFQRIWLLLLRQDARFTGINVKWLARRSQTTRKPIVAPGGPAVSLTTYDKRIHTVHLALESIAAGSILPSRIILWLDNADAFKNRPRSLHRLEERGLEIKLSQNYGPHTKYYPFLESTDTFEVPLVTADDDVLYPKSWLSGLVSIFNRDCNVISCYRAYEMKISNRTIAPYRNWGPCKTTKPSFLHFATACAGCIYPPAFLRILKAAGRGFEQRCPKADDVWLHANALRARFMIRQIQSRPLELPFVPETQDVSLYFSNIGLGQNDIQIKNTYTSSDIDTLVSSLS